MVSMCGRCTGGEIPGSLPLDIVMSSGSRECPVDVAAPHEGRMRCTYTAPAPGYYRLEITCRGTQLASSPFSVQVRRS